MGVESMKEYCHRLASRHPLLVFMSLVLILIYRSFPSIFALLIDASPVIASTTIVLGTLLFFGHPNEPEIQKEGKPHHKSQNLKLGIMGDTVIDWRGARPEGRKKASRKKNRVVHRVNINDNHHTVETDILGTSIDKNFTQEAKNEVGNQQEKIVFVTRCARCQSLEAKDGAHRNEEDIGCETGSELPETSSRSASMADMITPIADELHPIQNHPEVPQQVQMLNLNTDAELGNSEENHQGDIQVKDVEEKEEEKEEDQKNLVNPSGLPCDTNENIIERSSSDLSDNPNRQESDPVDSVPSKPNTEFSHHHESSDVGPSDLMAPNQEKQKYNLEPHVVPEPETPDVTNHSSMHGPVDNISNSNRSTTPDTESVGPPVVENDRPSQEADSTSMHRQMDEVSNSKMSSTPDTESVGSPLNENDSSREADLASMKKGPYTESVASSHYEDDPSREADLMSVKGGSYAESIGSSRYEDYPPDEADSISVKEGYDEDDYASIKGSYYAESVASAYTEDDPSREADTNWVKNGYCASEISDYVSQRSGSSDEDDTVKLHHDGRHDEVKTNGGGETGYQGKSRSESSSPFSDVNNHADDEEDEYHSVIMPLNLHSKDQKIQEQAKEISPNINSASNVEAVDSSVHDYESDSDHKQDDQSPKSEHDDSDSSVHESEPDSTVRKPNEGLLPQRFSQVQQGLTSWFSQSPKSEHDDSDSGVHESEPDSTVRKPNEGLLPQRFNQVQQGLTSWFTWKA